MRTSVAAVLLAFGLGGAAASSIYARQANTGCFDICIIGRTPTCPANSPNCECTNVSVVQGMVVCMASTCQTDLTTAMSYAITHCQNKGVTLSIPAPTLTTTRVPAASTTSTTSFTTTPVNTEPPVKETDITPVIGTSAGATLSPLLGSLSGALALVGAALVLGA